MGWFGGLFGGDSSDRSSDPLAKLDPKLREFLEKESPIKYKQKEDAAAQAAAEAAAAATATAQPTPSAQTTSAEEAQKPAVPPQSLYQDGRYAHLWKTYRPLMEVEAETKTDHERLMDVLDAYKDRRARIGRVALENCALEQGDWNECIKTGPWTSRMTMCHAEMSRFERCYNMQSRLLKALGYLSAYDRPPEVDEQIQLHADTLYHRMLDQEAAIEQAKAEGRPAPAVNLGGALSLPGAAGASIGTGIAASSTGEPPVDIPEELRKQWAEKLAKVPESERPAEEAAMRAELAARAEMAGRVQALRAAQTAAREQRKAEGKATLKDQVTGLFSGK